MSSLNMPQEKVLNGDVVTPTCLVKRDGILWWGGGMASVSFVCIVEDRWSLPPSQQEDIAIAILKWSQPFYE
jgi:hypothetical protein